ncbi:hypothetical protein AB0N81_31960 [Streptomyces sp. NPDC093510]|uniref:hypothetical protein n=1 Tax=Streptomyces sp. NPDC093510 TaxID=3155199 RepID=UPI003436127D
MLRCITRLAEPLLRFLLPASGRHRLVAVEPVGMRDEEAKRRRARRRALWLAVHGVDVGPRHIHGIEVAAA